MITIKQLNRILIFFSISLLASACYKNVKGCLDPFSNNYTAYSDEMCSECCTYPAINLNMSFFLGDESFDRAKFASSGMDSFFIINAGLYFHDFVFNANNGEIRVTEEVTLTNMDGSHLTTIDDFVKISTVAGINYGLGTHKSRDSIQSIQLSLGLPLESNQLDSASIPVTSDLSQAENLLHSSANGYYTAFMDIYYDTITKDTMRYSIPIADLSSEFLLDTQFLLDYGEILSVDLNVDLLKWTEGINFEDIGTDMEQVKTFFVQNIPNSISLR